MAAFAPEAIVPGRGPAVSGDEARQAIDETREYLRTLWEIVRDKHAADGTLKDAFEAARTALEPRFGDWCIFEHCLPFNVARAWDEADGVSEPRAWTAERDAAVWDELQA